MDLNAIAKLNCIATPEVIAFEEIDDYEGISFTIYQRRTQNRKGLGEFW